MREYGQIQCALWTNPRFKKLSEDARLLLSYLLTGPHSNGLGCYPLSKYYVCGDFGWTPERVKKGFDELSLNGSEKGFINYSETTEYVHIKGYLNWNPVSNANVAKARAREFKDLPTEFEYRAALALEMLEFGNHWGNGFETILQTVIQTDTQTRPDPTRPEQTRNLMSGKPDDAPEASEPEREDFAKEAIEYLNEKTGRNFKLVNSNLKLARARLREGHSLEDLKAVVDRKYEQWNDDPKRREYLRPATLFNAEKFNQYAGQLGDRTASDELDELFGSGGGAGGEFFEGEFQEVARA